MDKGSSNLSLKQTRQQAARQSLKAMLLIVILSICYQGYAQEDPLQKLISIPSQHTTLYQALNTISDITGYYFIYDSEVVNSDKKVNLSANNETLAAVIKKILGNENLNFRVVEKHILIYRVDNLHDHSSTANQPPDSITAIEIRGEVVDKETHKPLPFVSIGIVKLGLGTVTNTDGDFVLRLPPMARKESITISHIGYKQVSCPVSIFQEHRLVFYLETQYISIQEVLIKPIDPVAVIRQAMELRSTNYPIEPVYLTAFYREGVEKNKSYLSYSEAVFKIYKTSCLKSPDLDQVKLLKGRKMISQDQRDTLTIKMKAGINASLLLDVVKSIPDFLDEGYMKDYQYEESDIVSLDSSSAYAIEFHQKEGVNDPLFKGVIYVDVKSHAIVGVDFEVNPDYIDKITNQLVVRKSRKIKVIPEKVAYSVHYQKWDGKYYLSHLRGDIFLRVRKHHRLFASTYHTYFEMATIQRDSINVQRFPRQDVVRPFIVFSDENYTYDPSFWGDYSYIEPEENLSQALSRVAPKIEMVNEK